MRLSQGLLACACAGLVVYLVQDHLAHQREIAGLRAEMGAIARSPADPPPAVTVREIREIAAPRPDREGGENAAAAAPTASADAPSANRAPADATERRVQYNAKFSDEYRDAQWATASQDVATAKLKTILPPTSELKSVECRSSMCKIETTHEDAEHYRDFANNAFMNPTTVPWNGAFFSTGAEDPATGRFVAVAYLGREGQPLPQFE
jgi:hypothetical protein